MTLGKKLKEARKQAGLSQEQLSEKLGVSRSAVAKWETDNGIPDIENLRIISQLLGVSIDYLLDNGESVDVLVMREPYNLDDYGTGSKFTKKDRMVRDKFPNAEIHALVAEKKLTKSEKIIDNILTFFTDAPAGVPDLINSLKGLDTQYYLAEKEGRQFFVVVTDEFIETRRLANRIEGKRFEIGDMKFLKCTQAVK